MAEIKCVKCGANIPDKAAFCPSCGAPVEEKKPEPQVPAPVQKPKLQVSKSIPEMINSIFTETNMFIMVPLGILIAGIGGLIYLFGGYNIYRIGLIVNVIGCLFIGMFLLMGGITIKNYEKFVRLGMIVGGIIMITWTLSIPA